MGLGGKHTLMTEYCPYSDTTGLLPLDPGVIETSLSQVEGTVVSGAVTFRCAFASFQDSGAVSRETL